MDYADTALVELPRNRIAGPLLSHGILGFMGSIITSKPTKTRKNLIDSNSTFLKKSARKIFH